MTKCDKCEELKSQLLREEQKFENLKEAYKELTKMKEDLYAKQQELIKDHTNLLQRYFRS